MAKRKKTQRQPQPQTPVVSPKFKIEEPSGGTFYFYANLVYLTWTPFDVKIRFGELVKFDATESTVKEHAVATVAWAEAKSLMSFLQKAVAGYEQVNGEIKIAPELKLPPGEPLPPKVT